MPWFAYQLLCLLLITLSIQGCVTPIVIDKARGLVDFPTEIEKAQYDLEHKQFVICVSGAFDDAPEKYSIIVSENVILNNGDNRNSISRKSMDDQKKEHWWGYEERNNLHTYWLKSQVKTGCANSSTSDINLPIIRASVSGIMDTPDPLVNFTGDLIDSALVKNTPFAVYIPSSSLPRQPFFSNDLSPCEIKKKQHPCLLIVTKPKVDENSKEGKYTELLSVKEIINSDHAKPLWYVALPLSVVLDVAIITTITVVIAAGSMGGGYVH